MDRIRLEWKINWFSDSSRKLIGVKQSYDHTLRLQPEPIHEYIKMQVMASTSDMIMLE